MNKISLKNGGVVSYKTSPKTKKENNDVRMTSLEFILKIRGAYEALINSESASSKFLLLAINKVIENEIVNIYEGGAVYSLLEAIEIETKTLGFKGAVFGRDISIKENKTSKDV